MDIKVYLHRNKKHNFEVADCFVVSIDLNKLPEDKKKDLDYINRGFANDCRKHAMTRECIKKYGTAYVAFIRPQYEGPKEENGNDNIYFDNKEMLFMKKRKPRKKKITEVKDDKI